MLKRAAVLGGVLLALSLASAGWDLNWLNVQYPYNSNPGSAACAGLATDATGVTSHRVWNMVAEYLEFFAYDIDLGQKVPLHPTLAAVGKGGALAFVPDYSAFPPGGWVFALRGKDPSIDAGTREFWVYYPRQNVWRPAPPVPEDVIEGGSLCYGGIHDLHGRSYAILYAFTGQQHSQGGVTYGHFWRYTFPVVPYDYDSPLQGQWQWMQPITRGVGSGTALTWLPFGPATAEGTVAAILGPTDSDVWTWVASEDPPGPPWWAQVPTYPYSVNGGASMAPLANNYQVVFTYGGGTRDFHRWDATQPTQSPVPLDNTPEDVKYGAGLCQLGNICYLDIGTQTSSPVHMYRYFVPIEGGGGQAAGLSDLGSLRVHVGASPGVHRFDASGVTGPVRLVVTDVAGRLLKTAHSESRAGTASLTWTHPGLPGGVYLYRVSADGQSVGGKVTVLR